MNELAQRVADLEQTIHNYQMALPVIVFCVVLLFGLSLKDVKKQVRKLFEDSAFREAEKNIGATVLAIDSMRVEAERVLVQAKDQGHQIGYILTDLQHQARDDVAFDMQCGEVNVAFVGINSQIPPVVFEKPFDRTPAVFLCEVGGANWLVTKVTGSERNEFRCSASPAKTYSDGPRYEATTISQSKLRWFAVARKSRNARLPPRLPDTIYCQAAEASLTGSGIQIERYSDRENIGYWNSTSARAKWGPFRVQRAADYLVGIDQACRDGSGGRYRLTIGPAVLEQTPSATGDWPDFLFCELGQVRLEDDTNYYLEIVPIQIVGDGLMNVRTVVLRPTS